MLSRTSDGRVAEQFRERMRDRLEPWLEQICDGIPSTVERAGVATPRVLQWASSRSGLWVYRGTGNSDAGWHSWVRGRRAGRALGFRLRSYCCVDEPSRGSAERRHSIPSPRPNGRRWSRWGSCHSLSRSVGTLRLGSAWFAQPLKLWCRYPCTGLSEKCSASRGP